MVWGSAGSKGRGDNPTLKEEEGAKLWLSVLGHTNMVKSCKNSQDFLKNHPNGLWVEYLKSSTSS